MKINDKVLSLPPYISTSWQNISSIFCPNEHVLEIQLITGIIVRIPMNDKKIIDLIFHHHVQYLENKENKPQIQKVNIQAKIEKEPKPSSFALPFSFPMDTLLPFGQMLQHQPEASNSPEIPTEILSKVASFAKTISKETSQVLFPDVQPHCNCLYCQVGKAVSNQTEEVLETKVEEDLVSDEDLKFKEWDICKTTNALYEVKNPLDLTEVYQVFLGEPIGCTCGRNDCEHIKAVLNTEI